MADGRGQTLPNTIHLTYIFFDPNIHSSFTEQLVCTLESLLTNGTES